MNRKKHANRLSRWWPALGGVVMVFLLVPLGIRAGLGSTTLSPEKEQILRWQEGFRESGSPAPRNVFTAPAPEPVETLVDAIVPYPSDHCDLRGGGDFGRYYEWSNCWTGTVSGVGTIVTAGVFISQDHHGTQGLLLVSTFDAIGFQQYPSPVAASGPLTITSWQGDRISVEAQDGSTFVFDLDLRRYV